MVEFTDIEISLEQNDVNKIKEFIRDGGNIYKEFKEDSSFYVQETLMSRACREKKTEIVELLLDVYERDFKIAERLVSNDKCKEFLLKYILIAWSIEEIEKVIDISKKPPNNSKKILVFLAGRQECVLVPIVKDRALMYKLYKNGLLSINSRDKNKENPGHLIGTINRLDLLKRMVAIGLDFDHLSFTEKIINESTCIGLISYCLTELNIGHENLLQYTAKNKNIQVFEFVLEYLASKNGYSNKADYMDKYCKNDEKFVNICTWNINYELLAHLFTVYNIKIKRKTTFFGKFFKEPKSSDYIAKIIEIEKDNFDDILDSIEIDSNLIVLDEIWRALDKTTLKNINKNNIKMIIYHYNQSNSQEYFHMLDPLAIYDEDKENSALFIALRHNCEPMIRYLISKGSNLKHKNLDGHTTLTAACKYSTPEIIRDLLNEDVSLVHKIGSAGYYPLTELIDRNDSFVGVFKKLIKEGADIYVVDQLSNTLLHNAVIAQNIELVKACLEAGVDPSIKGLNDNTAFHLSAKRSLLEIFDLILETGKVDIETKNNRGNTILHNVCKTHYPHFFFSLVNTTKPNVNALNNAGQSPIHFCYDRERFHKLLEMGADTTIVSENNFPFYIAVAYEWRIDVLEAVFANPNIDLTITSTDGQTLLHCLSSMKIPLENYIQNENVREMFRKCTNTVSICGNSTSFQSAAATDNLQFVKYMFEYSDSEPDLEFKNGSGVTAIFGNLRYFFHKDVLEYLIEKGADVNALDSEGNSLIFQSAFSEGTEILLKAGASTEIINKKGVSALHHAALRNDFGSCLLLLKYGADLHLKDENDMKPVDLCDFKFLKDFLLYISD